MTSPRDRMAAQLSAFTSNPYEGDDTVVSFGTVPDDALFRDRKRARQQASTNDRDGAPW